MNMREISLNGLTGDEIRLVSRFVSLLRSSRNREKAREDFKNLWRSWKETAAPMVAEEVERLVEEVVTSVRDRR
ncbi:MAG: hypothetical protein HY719_08835 [Planctomycetes bacterium]|nr:hypothetical protein [Planctomycetota bacterium]